MSAKSKSTDFFIRKWESADKEEFKRSDHNDFATAAELKERKFSGIRNNSIAQTVEIWTEGDLRKSVSTLAVMQDEFAIEKAFEEVFAIKEARML